jgi:hypothetical protein
MAHRFMRIKRHSIGGIWVRGVGLIFALMALLYVPAAHAQVYTPPVQVDAIEQAQSTFSGGVTFVRLVGVACPGRSDGFFVLPSNSKQSLQLEILLTAIDRGLRVELNHNPTNCNVTSVVVCATASPC